MLRVRLWLFSTALVLAAGLAACGGNPPSGNRGDVGEEPDAGTPDTTPDTTPTQNARLVLLTEPNPSVSFSERVPIQVKYLDPDDQPIADAIVSFAPQQDTADSRISAANAFTDQDGVAETFIEAGIQEVEFTVHISAPDDDSVAPIDVDVRVQPKDASDYIIRVTYDGPITLNRVEVLLYDTDRACDTLTEDPSANPSPDTAWTSLVILPDAEGNIPDRGLNVPRTVNLQYAVARGEPADGQGGGASFFATFGCNDTVPPADVASAQVIEIPMHNMWPAVQGTYQISSEINLLNLIPDNVEQFIGPIGEIFSNPGQGLLSLVAVALGGEYYWDQDECEANGGSYCDIWPFLFDCQGDNPATPECDGEVTLNVAGTAAAGILEGLIDLGIAALPDAAGNTIRTVLAAGAAVFDNAENFSLGGNLVITQDADASGSLGNGNSVVFNQLTWTWIDANNSPVERTIQLRNESFIRGSDVGAALVFDLADSDQSVLYQDAYHIQIDPFDLSLNYGEILIWVLEGIVFPTFIGPDVNSFEDLFTRLVDCDDLGDKLTCSGPYAGTGCTPSSAAFAAPAIVAACHTLETTAVTALEDWLRSLTLDLSTYYHMGTPVDAPCQAGLVPGGHDFEIQSFGGSADVDHCKWAGEIRYSNGDTPESVDGVWWGEKL